MLLAFIAAVIAVLRLVGITAEPFQAVAHLFVGCLFGVYFANRDRLCLCLAVGLTALELIAFLISRIG